MVVNDARLTKKQRKLLRKIYSFGRDGAIVDRTDDDIARLHRLELIEISRIATSGRIKLNDPRRHICITGAGEDFLLRTALIGTERRRDTRRYWITTVIAIAALVIALLSLGLQSGLISSLRLGFPT